MTRAFVVGGGVAGIAAAFILRDRRFEVELLESHRWLGGRAFSLPVDGFGYRLDNGPHVMLGCYRDMRGLLRRIGTEAGFQQARALRLCYSRRGGGVTRLQLSRLPTPLALSAGLLRLAGVGFGAKLRALLGLGTVLFGAGRGKSLEDWIRSRRQHGAPRHYLWDPMCRAIMNAEAGDVSAKLFLSTLRQGFTGAARSSAIWIPAKPWSELIGEPARAAMERDGITVSCGARVAEFDVDGERVTRIRAGDGDRAVGADDLVVSAVPWHAYSKLLSVAGPRMSGSPLVSVYFEHDGPSALPEDPLTAFVDGDPFHFLCRRVGADPGQFAVLAGGCRSLEGLSVAEIEARARAQLADYFPDAGLPGDARARVVKESRATLLPSPGLERPRPGRHPSVRNLVVCGDWTDTGLPSTLEGAARSAALGLAREWPSA